MCLSALPACMSGVTHGWKSPCGCWELILAPLQSTSTPNLGTTSPALPFLFKKTSNDCTGLVSFLLLPAGELLTEHQK